MSLRATVPGNLKQESRRAARKATDNRLVETLIRLGFVVRGLIYAVIGILAFQVAVGGGGTLADPQGAIVTMGRTPVGGIVLYVILIGLIGYSMWGLIRAVFDPLHKGSDLKGIATRIGYAVSAASYALLAVYTYGLITPTTTAAGNGGQTAQTQKTAASLLTQPSGQLIVGIVAAIIMIWGITQIIQGLNRNFDRQILPYTFSKKWVDRLGQFGTAARGFVFTLIGMFLLQAAFHRDPSQAKGIEGVLAALLHQPYGPWLLGIVALGLVAFGAYSVLGGFWLRFKR